MCLKLLCLHFIKEIYVCCPPQTVNKQCVPNMGANPGSQISGDPDSYILIRYLRDKRGKLNYLSIM